jgi:predicted O-methyltransferase YrrM
MSGHQERWKERFGSMEKKNNKILELGCFKGEMSKWFSDNLLDNQYSRLYCVDTWEGSIEYKQNYNNVKKTFKNNIETTFQANIKKSKYPKKIKIFKNTTTDFFLTFLKKEKKPIFDLIYVDASHDARNVMCDAILSFKALKVGGHMVFDDYEWKKMPHNYEKPKVAVDSFVHIFRDNVTVTHKGYKLIVKKTKEYLV